MNRFFPKILADSMSHKQKYQVYEEWQDIVQFLNRNVCYIFWTAKNFQINFELLKSGTTVPHRRQLTTHTWPTLTKVQGKTAGQTCWIADNDVCVMLDHIDMTMYHHVSDMDKVILTILVQFSFFLWVVMESCLLFLGMITKNTKCNKNIKIFRTIFTYLQNQSKRT